MELEAHAVAETRRRDTMHHVVDRPDAPDNGHGRVELAPRQPRVVPYRMHDRHVPLQRQQDQIVGGREEQRPVDVSADPEATVEFVDKARQFPAAGVDGQGGGDDKDGAEQVNGALVDDQHIGVVFAAGLHRHNGDNNEEIADDADAAKQDVDDLLRRGCDAYIRFRSRQSNRVI